jgi:hypothetical protein
MMGQCDYSPAAQAARVAVVAFVAAEAASYAAFYADCDAKAAARMAVEGACPACAQPRCRKLRCVELQQQFSRQQLLALVGC